jgi:hypothetical protein
VLRIRFLLLASLLIAASAAAEPPARVVRLNLTDGVVSFRPAGIDEWTDATINRPLIDGDRLWTDAASRAEMHIGSAAVRLGPSTSFSIVSETDRIAQLSPNSGTMNVRAQRRRGQRGSVLKGAFDAHPERFVRGMPRPPAHPTAAWINPPVVPFFDELFGFHDRAATIIDPMDPVVSAVSN